MNKKQRIAAVTGVVLAAVAAAGGVAVATGDDGDVTVQGPEADRATEAALAATGGGTANSVERDSENGATWEVEVTREDGTTVDVRLDENYGVVVIEGDGDESGD
ncbi:MAG: PepSY domain-containing protein [Nocardioides sp.]